MVLAQRAAHVITLRRYPFEKLAMLLCMVDAFRFSVVPNIFDYIINGNFALRCGNSVDGKFSPFAAGLGCKF